MGGPELRSMYIKGTIIYFVYMFLPPCVYTKIKINMIDNLKKELNTLPPHGDGGGRTCNACYKSAFKIVTGCM